MYIPGRFKQWSLSESISILFSIIINYSLLCFKYSIAVSNEAILSLNIPSPMLHFEHKIPRTLPVEWQWSTLNQVLFDKEDELFVSFILQISQYGVSSIN